MFLLTSKGGIMRKTLLALSMLAGLAGLSATPANAAPLAHNLVPSLEALLPVVNMTADAVVSEGASVQEVQYYRRRYARRNYRRRYFRRY